jgi:hypothetical protein
MDLRVEENVDTYVGIDRVSRGPNTNCETINFFGLLLADGESRSIQN